MILVKTLPLIQEFKIYNDKKELINFNLWSKQIEIYHIMQTCRFIVLLKPRQFGMSILTGGDSILQCITSIDFVFLCLSVTGPDSEEYLDKAFKLYKSLPNKFKDYNPIKKKSVHEIEFMSGSKFISLPASRGYGYTADRVCIDEFFKINPTRSKITIREVLNNIVPVLDKRKGQLIQLGTADGMNEQRQIYLRAKNSEEGTKAIFVSCWDDPNMTPEIRKKKAGELKNPEDVNQEYPRTDREAFLSSGRPRFNRYIIEDHYEKNRLEPKIIGNISDSKRIELNPKGSIQFYRKKKERGQYLISGDVSEGLEKQDYSCLKVWDMEEQNQVAQWHGHIEHAELGTEAYKLGCHYNNAIIAIEANNHGHTPLERLVTFHKYPKALIHKSKLVSTRPDDKFRDLEKRLGWLTTGKTKKTIIDYLAQLIEEKQAPYFNTEDINELYSYIYEKNGATNAESGQFDDRVMTTAIGLFLLRFYPFKFWDDRYCCDICKFNYMKECTKTKRITTSNSICKLFVEDQSYFDMPKSLKRRGFKRG